MRFLSHADDEVSLPTTAYKQSIHLFDRRGLSRELQSNNHLRGQSTGLILPVLPRDDISQKGRGKVCLRLAALSVDGHGLDESDKVCSLL